MKKKNFEPLKHFLKSNDWDYELTELHEANINVSEKNGFYIYNYGNAVLVPRDDPIIRLCRGIVLNENGHLFNFPFTRFFNHHEEECDLVDMESAVILEKFDGSLISVWHTGEEWEVTTRGSFYPSENAHNFKETFIRLFKEFDKLQPGLTYMFEMVSKDNRIVTKYDEEFVALIGSRHLGSMREFDQDALDSLANTLGVRRPKRFKATNIEECRALFEDFKDDEEGLVIVDGEFNRKKLKQESYLKMAKIVSMKPQDVLDYMLGRTELDADFTDMPELRAKINEVKTLYNGVKIASHGIYDSIKDIETQKDFAEKAKKYKISSILFGLRKGVPFDKQIIRYDRLVEYHNAMVIPTLKKLIVLRGMPGSGKSTWVKENGLELYTLSMDAIRIMFQAPIDHIDQSNNKRVWELFMEMLTSRMKTGSFTVLDAMHISDSDIKQYSKLADQYGFEVETKWFLIDYETALKRNREREKYKQLPEHALNKIYGRIKSKGL